MVPQTFDWQSSGHLKVCFIDGARKETDKFSGQGWFCRGVVTEEKMMGPINLWRSLSALHAECKALIWAMECMKIFDYQNIVFATDCSQLVKIVSSPDEWPAFATHLEKFRRSKTFFPSFKIQHIRRETNQVAELARGARSSPSAVFYIDSIPPVWLTEPVETFS